MFCNILNCILGLLHVWLCFNFLNFELRNFLFLKMVDVKNQMLIKMADVKIETIIKMADIKKSTNIKKWLTIWMDDVT